MLDHAIWGLWAGGYLLTNIVLHLLNALLLYRLLFRLVNLRLAAWFGAALFLLHPVQVESVAWISQRKNLLAMLFFLLAWEFYLRYRESVPARGHLYYLASLASLLLALLSKSVVVIFPVVILIFDHCYPLAEGRFRLRDKVPYLLVAVVAAVLAILSQTPDYSEWGAGGGRAGYHGGSAMATFLTMFPVYCSYLRLIVWPVDLSALYDPAIHKGLDLTVLASLFLLGAILLAVYRIYRKAPCIAFWPVLSFIGLLPVSQIVPLVTLMNDRYLYFPMIGVAGLGAYGIKIICDRYRISSAALAAGMAALLLVLAGVSFQRSSVWRDSAVLWSDTVRKAPNNYVAWEGLAESLHYGSRPRRSDAITAYRRAIELNPNGDISRYNLGVAYIELNDYGNAEKILGELLKRSPNNVMGWTAFGDLALRRSQFAEAEARFRKANSFQPEAVQVHQKIGNLMIILGRIDEARSSYLQIENIQGGHDPLNAYELARIESLAGDAGASIQWLEKALQRGYSNYDGIFADEELSPIRSDGRFGNLVSKYFPKQR
jgi:tetratricopeptide (TPR) repeat protein